MSKDLTGRYLLTALRDPIGDETLWEAKHEEYFKRLIAAEAVYDKFIHNSQFYTVRLVDLKTNAILKLVKNNKPRETKNKNAKGNSVNARQNARVDLLTEVHATINVIKISLYNAGLPVKSEHLGELESILWELIQEATAIAETHKASLKTIVED